MLYSKSPKRESRWYNMRIVSNEHTRCTLLRTKCTHVNDPNWFRTAPPSLAEVLSLKRALPKKLYVGDSKVKANQCQVVQRNVTWYEPNKAAGYYEYPAYIRKNHISTYGLNR